MLLRVLVYGPPIPKASVRSGGGHHFIPRRSRDYMELVRLTAAREVQLKRAWNRESPMSMIVRITCADDRRRDEDNIIKSIKDGLKGPVYVDDSQVKVCCSQMQAVDKRNPHVRISIMQGVYDFASAIEDAYQLSPL